MDGLKKIGHLFLCYVKLYALFQSHQWIKTGVQKHSIRVKIGDFFPRVSFKFDGWPWKTVGHLFYATSNFVLHFTTISEIKLKVTVWKHSIWVKIGNFQSVWPRNLIKKTWKIIGHIFCATSSFGHHFTIISLFKLKSQSGNAQFGSKSVVPSDLKIWQMTLKNTRAPLLCHFKLCASFHCHIGIQTDPQTAKLCFDLCDLKLWPLALTFCMEVTFQW